MRWVLLLALGAIAGVSGRSSPPPPQLISPTLLDFDEPLTTAASTPEPGLDVSTIAALPPSTTPALDALPPATPFSLDASLPAAPTTAAAGVVCPVCPAALACPPVVACPPSASGSVCPPVVAPACPPAAATPLADCPICPGAGAVAGVGPDGKLVADLMYQVLAASGSFDPTTQKLTLEGVGGIITALKVDPTTDAKMARRHTPAAFFSDKFIRNGTWLNKPNAGMYASLGSRSQQLAIAFQIGNPQWSASRGAVQMRAVQVDPRSTLRLTGGIANSIVDQEEKDGKVLVAKSKITFQDVLMFIDSVYQPTA